MKTSCRYGCLVFLVLLVALVGCGAPVAPTTPPTHTPPPPTETRSPIVVPSPTPSPEPPTETPAPSPSPTPAPTMTADEEYALVSQMLQDNGGCRLPCWWGFTPGETPWETSRTFFASLGKETVTWSSDDAQHFAVYFHIPDRNHVHSQGYHEKNGTLDRIGVHAALPTDEDGHYLYGDPQFAEDWQAYMLTQILKSYQAPSQAFLGTGSAPWSPFDLLLFYPEEGFLVQYSGVAEEREGKTWLVCPHLAEITLQLWPPGRITKLGDVPGVVSAHADDPTWGPYSLEEATGLSIDEFYEIFVQPGNQACLETPADLW